MKKIYNTVLGLLLISCSVKESEEESIAQHQNNASSPALESLHSDTQTQFTKKDIKGVWTSGETENASFNIEEDSILFVDSFEYLKYELRNDTLIYIENDVPFFKTRIIKADKDSLVTSNQDGIRRFWRFKD